MTVYEETRSSKRLLIGLGCIYTAFIAMGLLLGQWFFGSLYGTAMAALAVGVFALHRRQARAHDLDLNLDFVRRLNRTANLWLLLVGVSGVLAVAASFFSGSELRLLIGLPSLALSLLGRMKAGSAWAELVRTANSLHDSPVRAG